MQNKSFNRTDQNYKFRKVKNPYEKHQLVHESENALIAFVTFIGFPIFQLGSQHRIFKSFNKSCFMCKLMNSVWVLAYLDIMPSAFRFSALNQATRDLGKLANLARQFFASFFFFF